MFKFSPAISRVFFFKTQYYNKLLIIAIQRERFEQPITDHRQRKCMLDFLLTFYSPVILDFNNKTFTSDFIGEKKISPSDYYFNYILIELKWIIYHQWFLTSLIFWKFPCNLTEKSKTVLDAWWGQGIVWCCSSNISPCLC